MKKAILAIFVLAPLVPAQPDPHKMTKADVDRQMQELSNWGRWGKDDQLGTLNLITPQKRKQAAALVKEGFSISLSHDVLTEKTQDNPNPLEHKMILLRPDQTTGFFMDEYSVNYHGFAHTHMDALCHAAYEGKTYNGFPISDVSEKGCEKDSIIVAKNGIVTRGILMDIAALKGVPYLEPGTPIYPEDLDAWEKKAGVKVGPGDAIFIHTGRWKRRDEKGPSRGFAGLHASCAKWLHDRGVAILGSDDAQDVMPSQVQGVALPVHQLVLVAMGLYIFDDCDLEPVSQEAAKRKRWEFMLTASPMVIGGGTGSPLNPIATF
ncbi:MAG TPA: cyclase family protein [Bryobacteraceae bacterium]|nr:cyclase family protein [Bryobacteraceae bacterium]